MKAVVSTKGQVVIPHNVRKMLGIHPGDEVTVKSSQNQIIMEKVAEVSARPRLKISKGKMPLIKMPKGAEPLTPEMVREIAQL
jgi:AbrB family looped-hinge helix DNA binding protein